MIGRGRRGDILDEGLEALNLLFQENERVIFWEIREFQRHRS